jgi:type II secretory pathway component PulK
MKPRSGYALMTIVLMLGIVALMLGSITIQMALNRTAQAQREARLQALWLARSGLEQAAGRLMAAAEDYRGETLELLPGGTVRIEIERDGEVQRITSEASYAGTLSHPVVRVEMRSYRLHRDGGRVRLEPVAATMPAP